MKFTKKIIIGAIASEAKEKTIELLDAVLQNLEAIEA